MGIDGLLKFLQPLTTKEHISSFRGKTIAIDMMPWLYKACYQYAYQLNQPQPQPTPPHHQQNGKFMQYIYEMLDLLEHYNIKPLCVFDGRYVVNKQATISKRRQLKQQNKEKGLQQLQQGNEQQARKYLSKCINITQSIISHTINALHTRSVNFMVSPYESDSQIAKLYTLGLVDCVITEDSDLVIYGVRTILKLNTLGECDYIDLEGKKQSDVNSIFLKQFIKMDRQRRLQVAILAGTDYNQSIKGIGIKKSLKYLELYSNMHEVVQKLKQNKLYADKIPTNYHQVIDQAKLIFLFATTYNPESQKLQFLNQKLRLSSPFSQIQEEQLRSIVGKFYQFGKAHAKGQLNVKNHNKRQINIIQVQYKSTLDPLILNQKQQQNLQRRQQQQSPITINILPLSSTLASTSTSANKEKVVRKQLKQSKLQLSIQQQRELRLLKEERYNEFKKMLQVASGCHNSYEVFEQSAMMSQSCFNEEEFEVGGGHLLKQKGGEGKQQGRDGDSLC